MALPKIGATIVLDGEKEYRQAISEVNRSMTVMRSEMKLLKTEYDGQLNTLEALQKKNDLLTKEYDSQDKKLRTMVGALENAKKQYGENSRQAADWQIKVNNASSELGKLDKELKQNEKYMKEAKGSTDKCATSIDEFGKEIKQTSNETLSFGDILKANLTSETIVAGVKAMGGALKSVGEGALNAVKETAAYADEVLTMSNNTGIATDTLQELMYMQELTDVSVETVTGTMAKQIKSMANAQKGTTDYVNAYKKLNVEITDANGNLRDGETVYWEIIDSFGEMSNETERDAIAMQLLGRSAQDVNSLVKIGSEGVNQFAQEARDMGAVLSGETLGMLGDADDAFQRMNGSLDILQRELGLAMAPSVTSAIEKVTEKLSDMKEPISELAAGALEKLTGALVWILDNGETIAAVLGSIAAGFVALKVVKGVTEAVTAFTGLSSAVKTAGSAVTGLWTVISAHPVGAAVVAISALTVATVAYVKASKDAADETEKAIASRAESRAEMEAEALVCGQLVDELKELQSKTSLTADEQSRQKAIIDQLNNVMPDLNLKIDEQTGHLNTNIEALEGNVEALMALSRAEAARELLQDNAKEQVEKQKELNDLLKQQKIAREEIDKAMSKLPESVRAAEPGTVGGMIRDAFTLLARYDLDEADAAVIAARKALSDLKNEYNETMSYISDQEALSSAAQGMETLKETTEGTTKATEEATQTIKEYLESFGVEMQEVLDEQYEAYADTLDSELEAAKDMYEDKSKELEKSQKKELKQVQNANKEELEALSDKHADAVKLAEEATKKELTTLKAAHAEKLALINEEYAEKLKLVDEERYNKTQELQSQIDAINATILAEEEAEKAKTEATKRAKLEKAIAQSETDEQRLEAMQNLADFEEELRKEKLAAERQAAIDALKAQIEAYNDECDARQETLEEELKAKQETVDAEYEAEKEKIKDALELKKESLAEELEAERETIKERQELYAEELAERFENAKESLKKEQEHALKVSKETNDELLKQYKELNVAKLADAKATAESLYQYSQSNPSVLAPMQPQAGINRYQMSTPTASTTTSNSVVNNSPIFNTTVRNGADLNLLVNQINRTLAQLY